MNYIDFSEEESLKNYFSHLEDLEPNEENVDMAEQMAVHLQGASPEKLLNTLRPNEHPDILAYRLEIYEPTTKSHGKRITNALSKIQKQSSYNIHIEEQSNINEKETLNYYVENFPQFKTLSKWVFDSALEYSLVDPNALVVILPIDIPKTDTSYYKPMPLIFGSEMIVDEGYNYYTIQLEEINKVKEDGRDAEYNVYLIVSDKSILKVKQVARDKYTYEVLYTFDFDRVPAFKLGGDIIGGKYPLEYESFVSGILPYWNKAVRMDSDLDGSYTLHMYPERVEMETECKSEGCFTSESGKHVRLVDDKEIYCSDCGGSGWVTGRSPYGVTQVKKEDSMEDLSGTIFPGVVYIEKDTKIVELVEKKIESLITGGFSSINLDILDSSGENQSGVAKVIDRDAMNSFFVKVSNNVFDNIYANTLELISLWRYGMIVPFDITKPVNFDYTSIESLTADLKSLRESNANQNVIAQTEMDLIGKRFFGRKSQISKDSIDLDPYYGKTEEDKANMLLAGGSDKINYVISSNIYNFILRAYSENEDFASLEREKKIEILKGYANEFKQGTEEATKIEIQPNGQGG